MAGFPRDFDYFGDSVVEWPASGQQSLIDDILF